jgi:hypothetical protein
MKIEPSGRLVKVPAIGVAAVLSITVKTVPFVSALLPASAKENCAPLLMVMPRATTLSALASLEFNQKL